MPAKTKTPEAPENTTPTPEPTPDVAQNGQEAPAKPARKKAPDTSGIKPEAIQAAIVTSAPELLEAGKPTRERSEEQKVMDGVVERAYALWVKADRPSQWLKMPVGTYYLADSKEVEAYMYLLKRAAAITEPMGDDTGVRINFGNTFTLSEERAAKNGMPENAGKLVLMWAAIAKRPVNTDDKRKNVVKANQEAKQEGTAPERPS